MALRRKMNAMKNLHIMAKFFSLSMNMNFSPLNKYYVFDFNFAVYRIFIPHAYFKTASGSYIERIKIFIPKIENGRIGQKPAWNANNSRRNTAARDRNKCTKRHG